MLFFYPKEGNKTDISQRLQWFLARLLTAFNFLFIFLHTVVCLRKGRFNSLSDDIIYGAGFACTLLSVKLVQMRHRRWSNFMRRLTDFTKYDKPKDYDKLVKKLNLLSKMNNRYVHFSVLIFYCLQLWNRETCERNNIEKGIEDMCGVILPFWWPSPLTPMQTILISTIQTIAALIYVPVMAIIIVLPTELVEIIHLRVKHFCELLTNVFDERFSELEEAKRLKYCTQYHIELLEIGMEASENISILMAHVVFIASVVSASTIYSYILNPYQYVYLFITLAWIIGITLSCRSGQVLQETYSDILDAAYLSKWHQTSISNKKILLFLMMRTSKTISVKALPCGVFSYALLVNIFKATYSFLTLMVGK
ncbi:uncharacterized protein LOC143199890 [Rhynchophorus ferrugineus]|uniref:uncharacterized protein LOC143199890 n=1 Tax=Rhynchophorus ferrugineus TaxID=354439 RepID=UPI003FCCB28C